MHYRSSEKFLLDHYSLFAEFKGECSSVAVGQSDRKVNEGHVHGSRSILGSIIIDS